MTNLYMTTVFLLTVQHFRGNTHHKGRNVMKYLQYIHLFNIILHVQVPQRWVTSLLTTG